MTPIVSAVAEFNGRNLVEPHSRWYGDPLRFVPDRHRWSHHAVRLRPGRRRPGRQRPHTIIRWSGKAIDDTTHVESLVISYLDAVRPFVSTLSLQDVRLAAWTSFFLRYTNLKYSSARHLPPYRLALLRMSEVIRGRAPTSR